MRGRADVIIVGAGPAGAVTAMLLARAGHDVLLLDRHHFPRSKACGDCLSAGATDVLRELDLLERVERIPHARLLGWRIVAPDGAEFTSSFAAARHVSEPAGTTRHALAMERSLLDAALVEAATAAGVRFAAGVSVIDVSRSPDGAIDGVRTRDGAFHAPLVIGADGLRSVVARRIGAVRRAAQLRKVSLTVHVDHAIVDRPFGEMHSGDGFCAGVAPIRPDRGRCNLTVVADSTRYGRDVGRDPLAFIEHVVQRLPRLRGRVPAAALAGRTVLSSGPFDVPASAATAPGVALAGDAAGYFDPFTGQGIYQALTGAIMLAAAADDALRGSTGAALGRYEHQRRIAMRGPRIVQRGIEAVLSRPRLANAAIARVARARPFAAAMIAVTGDMAPVRTLLAPHVLLSLFAKPQESPA
jgi:menaquinone-9 beta-reductase